MEFRTFAICEILLAVSSYTALALPASDHQVTFSAGLTNTLHIQGKSKIIYDKVFINEKNGYDRSTGAFTAPLPGVYVFHFHAYCTNIDTVMWLELHHNDVPVASVSGYNSHTVGSNTIILSLKPGDHVQVKSRDGQQFSLFGLPDQVYSTFTGFMLHTSKIFMDSGIVG